MPERINVTRSSLPPFEEYCAEIREIWDSHWLTNMGVKHQTLEEELSRYLGCEYLALFTNGHLALENILEAFDLHGEIITTPFTFASTTHAIVRCGCTPVFCDIEPDNYTLDPDKLEALITDKTVAILPVHVYGNLCDVDTIGAIAARHGLPVIYDAAHSFGVFKDGVSSANFGDAAMFSFHATKVFHSIEGGAVCCRDGATRQRLCDLKNFGIHGPEDVPFVGGNAKMNEFAAAMGICNLRHLTAEIAKRKLVAERYDAQLSGVPGLKLNRAQPGVQANYAYYPVVFDGYKYSRDEVYDRLAAEDIIARKYFYPLTNSFACYAGKPGFDPADTPVAAYMADRVLTLPLYADLSLADVDRICKIILE
ncbi:MAG: DegT/DnrJ/EryC1/StrS family aminotransferase [Oscillospiraceae bacterium]|nr:DegT/DnrJ/EryC1/StrS family aminotransferase [Oscillospiraceae bacterium]MBQ9250890.1 DegT/DnrJ/EryC1/StrS family aminotransferase [Oscillospiraceae bacterium]